MTHKVNKLNFVIPTVLAIGWGFFSRSAPSTWGTILALSISWRPITSSPIASDWPNCDPHRRLSRAGGPYGVRLCTLRGRFFSVLTN